MPIEDYGPSIREKRWCDQEGRRMIVRQVDQVVFMDYLGEVSRTRFKTTEAAAAFYGGFLGKEIHETN